MFIKCNIKNGTTIVFSDGKSQFEGETHARV